MKTNQISLLFLFIVLSSNVYSQNLGYARKIVDTLASKTFKGRGYVGSGSMLTAEYIQNEYEKLGLQSFTQGYHQYFNIDVNTFPSAMEVKINNTELQPGKDYLVDPSSPSVSGTFKTYTLNPEKPLSQTYFKKIFRKSEGRTLIIDARQNELKNQNLSGSPENITHYFNNNTHFNHVAMLNITDKKLTWGISGKQHTRSSITINTKLRTDTINEIHLNIDAKQIQYKTSNVIGFIEGTHEPDSFLVLTAHYDHLGMMGNKTIFPGANDNASGVAMLLNLAKFYGANPHRYSMVFMALSAEELGLIGAKYFVDNPYFNLGKIKFLINFDLAGTGDEGIKVVNGGVYKKHFNKLQSLNSQGDYLPAIKPRGEACNSDHCLFYQQGVPCFYIYTLGGIQAYHDIYDKAETLPLTEFENYCQLMIDFVNSF